MSLRRTQYWNPSTGTVRAGDTAHGESVTDVESYLEPIDRFRTAGLHHWGIADGLRVSATLGATGVKVGLGMAVDATGRTVVLEAGGVAVVVPVDPEQVLDVPTVVVGLDGVTVATDGLTGENRDMVLTVTWREAQDNQLAGAPALVHAPWFRLVPRGGLHRGRGAGGAGGGRARRGRHGAVGLSLAAAARRTARRPPRAAPPARRGTGRSRPARRRPARWPGPTAAWCSTC